MNWKEKLDEICGEEYVDAVTELIEQLLDEQKSICRREFFTTIQRKINPIIHQGLETAPSVGEISCESNES